MKENKLIAEFMGVNVGEYTSYPEESPTQYVVGDLKYDISWDWLMPVVEKIEAELEEEFRVVILEHECSIHQKTEDNKLQIKFQCVVERFETSKIKATYEAVVEFIKQYNK